MIEKVYQMMASILESIEDGIYVVDRDYTIEYMNEPMVRLFGAGVGRKCYEVLAQSDKICPWCRAEKVFAGESIKWELYIPRLDKTFHLIEQPLPGEKDKVSKLSIYRDITLEKKQAEKIKTSEAKFRNLFEHVGVGVYISSKEGKFLDANRELLKMLGYESKEAFLQIDIKRDLYLRPEDRDTFQAMIERDGRVVDYEVTFKRKDGSPLPILLTGHVRYDPQGNVIGYEGINVDQTQRKLMEKELKEAYDFINKIIESSPNSIMAADMRGNIMIWNRAAEVALGYRAEDVIGKMHITRIYPEGLAYKIMRMIRSTEHGGVGMLRSYPMVYVRQDGSVVDGSLSAALVYDSSGKAIASVGSFVDLTQRLEMEHALRNTQEQLLQSEKLAAMGRLTSQIAHEINNPLYGILNTLELMKSEIPPENKRRKLLDMSISECMRLAEMLRKMLSFSKPDQEEKSAVDLNSIIDEILLLNQKQLQENSIRIKAKYADVLPEIVASKNQLRQVFLNLISNARDAMPDGGELHVTTRSDDAWVFAEFTDTGVGIKDENIKHVFDTFFTTKDSVKGVGLGLSVCYGFIKDHGGDIEVSSNIGEGTTFTISLPTRSSADTTTD